MNLVFPNECRSFIPTKNHVRFWGYVDAIEITFMVEEDALRKIYPSLESSEKALLDVFDSSVEKIHETARAVYKRSRDRAYAYVLKASDF